MINQNNRQNQRNTHYEIIVQNDRKKAEKTLIFFLYIDIFQDLTFMFFLIVLLFDSKIIIALSCDAFIKFIYIIYLLFFKILKQNHDERFLINYKFF